MVGNPCIYRPTQLMAIPTAQMLRCCSLLTPTNASHLLYLFLCHIYSHIISDPSSPPNTHTHTALLSRNSSVFSELSSPAEPVPQVTGELELPMIAVQSKVTARLQRRSEGARNSVDSGFECADCVNTLQVY